MSGTEKYNPLKDEIFLPIPIKIARRKDISDKAKLVYGLLLKTLGKFKECRITMAKIGKELNIPRQKVSKYISELKNKMLITINKTGKASIYDFLPINDVTHAVTVDVTHAVTVDVTHAVTVDVTHAVTPLNNREVLKESFKESEATPDFLKKLELWRSITLEYRRDLNKKQVVKCSIEKIEYAIERMNIAINKGGDPAKAFQNALKGDHAKFTRKMEDKAVAEQKEHDNDIVKLAEAANKREAEKEPDKAIRVLLIKKFREALPGVYDNHTDEAIACLPPYMSFERNELRR